MPNHHPSRARRGCGLCTPHKRRGVGRAAKEPVSVRRQLGITRRLRRNDLPR